MVSMPSSAVRSNISDNRAAPSSMEYSVCTWRWTNESRDPADIGGERPLRRMRADRPAAAVGRPRLSIGEEQSDYATDESDGGTPRRQSDPLVGLLAVRRVEAL